MKIRPKLSAAIKPAKLDAVKTMKLKSGMQQLSFEQRAKELGVGTKIKLNLKGNRRGMQNAGDSQQMIQVRSMRRLWNAKMPVMHCSNCSFSQQCPQFKAGYECAFNRFFDSHIVQNESDLIFYAKQLCEQAMKRSQKMLLMETLSGGAPSLETSEALSIAFAQLMQLYDRVTESAEVEIESSDTTIIGQLFGGLSGLMANTKNYVDNPIAVPSSHAESLLADTPIDEMAGDPATRKVYDPALIKSIIGLKPMSEEMPT